MSKAHWAYEQSERAVYACAQHPHIPHPTFLTTTEIWPRFWLIALVIISTNAIIITIRRPCEQTINSIHSQLHISHCQQYKHAARMRARVCEHVKIKHTIVVASTVVRCVQRRLSTIFCICCCICCRQWRQWWHWPQQTLQFCINLPECHLTVKIKCVNRVYVCVCEARLEEIGTCVCLCLCGRVCVCDVTVWECSNISQTTSLHCTDEPMEDPNGWQCPSSPFIGNTQQVEGCVGRNGKQCKTLSFN